jgi:DNA (cytosine-5)-methyltransferase 1
MADGKLERGLRLTECSEQPAWDAFPTQPPICGRNDGLPTELDGITFSKWRKESIKSYGNAIVPQVAYELFKAIKETEKRLSSL